MPLHPAPMTQIGYDPPAFTITGQRGTVQAPTVMVVQGSNPPVLILDEPPCSRAVDEPTGDIALQPEFGCAAWKTRHRYELRAVETPRVGELCDPTKPDPVGYRCTDVSAGYTAGGKSSPWWHGGTILFSSPLEPMPR